MNERFDHGENEEMGKGQVSAQCSAGGEPDKGDGVRGSSGSGQESGKGVNRPPEK